MTATAAPSWLAIAAAVTPLAVSLAANITWGVSTGSAILVVAGIVTPLLLVLAIERWRVMPPAVGVQWWVRTLAMSGVVVVVAGWSWLHATALLLAEVEKLHPGLPAPGMDTVLRNVELTLCVLAPLAIDGLAVLSVLALDVDSRTPSADRADDQQTCARILAFQEREDADDSTEDGVDEDTSPGEREPPPLPPDWWASAELVPARPSVSQPPRPASEVDEDHAARLIAEGAGRRRLAKELEISEHAARELLAEHRGADATAGATR
ncbi:hypothetical protein [Pseudonocardia sp. ICBG601]|uniref:hypothetical protein n=1 Tax=Pseudonocardia sp. ICBG601 TaxID=2846759 RepID=UPI001CF6FD27|nr:hypothetical protein [Pseudonocardia sp. ICBG601]